MQSLSVSAPAATDERAEIEKLKIKLEERRRELTELQKEFREFKARYAQIVGSGLAELAEVEREIKKAEARLVGAEEDEEAPAEAGQAETDSPELMPVKKALRRLFWSVAKMFHPDHAADESEARRRHQVMAEASRAYREGDADSLHTLLDDAEIRSYCAAPPQAEAEDVPAQRFRLKEEIRTIEFGIRRVEQDRLYLIKLKADEEARHGRDALLAMSERTRRQIVKARRRLEHLS